MLIPISKAAKPTHMTTANSAHSEQQEIRDGSRIFFTYILGLLASVTDGS